MNGGTEIRLLSAGAGLLQAVVLLDSGVEHYRGSFHNPSMWLSLLAATSGIGVDGARLLTGPAQRLPVARGTAQAGAATVGLVGLGFHLFNIDKRPGGFSFGNLFHAAPLGAPAALVLAGAISAAADRTQVGVIADGRALAGLCAAGIAGTVAEAGLLHFRGAFQNPAMWLPIALPPLAAALLARDAASGSPRRATAAMLGVTAAVGVAGVAFHAHGIARRMGGWRNWRQNLLAGPPLPAPPAFTGLAIAGLGALMMMRRTRG
ncbi:hypothetical protein [Sphingomonas panaciterrae]|uniref:hypothetical protein n=1 Tax=Sphingomonas panaciterrae TaxID=1462999 RepID=UPI002FF3A53C